MKWSYISTKMSFSVHLVKKTTFLMEEKPCWKSLLEVWIDSNLTRLWKYMNLFCYDTVALIDKIFQKYYLYYAIIFSSCFIKLFKSILILTQSSIKPIQWCQYTWVVVRRGFILLKGLLFFWFHILRVNPFDFACFMFCLSKNIHTLVLKLF